MELGYFRSGFGVELAVWCQLLCFEKIQMKEENK